MLMVAAGALVAPTATWAQGSEAEAEAMEHDRQAAELYQDGEYEQALEHMQAAQALLPATPRLYNIAACHERMGNLSEAMVYYQRFIELDDAPPERRARAEERIEALRAELGADPAESVDPLGEGDEGASEDRGFQPPPPAPTDRRRLSPGPFWAMVVLAGVTGVTSIITGAVTLSRQNEWDAMSWDEQQGNLDLRDSGRSLAVATEVIWITAAASAVTALVLAFFTDFDGDDATAALTPTDGGLAVGLSGRF